LAASYLLFMNRVVLREQRTGRNILQDTLGEALGPSHAQVQVLAGASAKSYGKLLTDLVTEKQRFGGATGAAN
jgi:hypothetical protein